MNRFIVSKKESWRIIIMCVCIVWHLSANPEGGEEAMMLNDRRERRRTCWESLQAVDSGGKERGATD